MPTIQPTVQPFKINISTAVLDDLQQRLRNTRWLSPVKEETGWEYGTDITYLKELADYWQTGYQWSRQEEELNKFDHFKAKLDGYNLHFIHERGKSSAPVALLLLHG